jgi:hypothetical protein
MALARVDFVTADPMCTLPVSLEQPASRTSTIIAGLFIALAAMVLLAPFSLLAAQAAAEPAHFLATIRQPAIAVQLGLALFVAIAFVSIPLLLLVRRSRQPRRIVISETSVCATGAPSATWSEPLTAYEGIAHHIRTSLSGAQHELVLVHQERSKSVVLHISDRIAQPQIDAVAALLKVSEVPARSLYERRGRPQNQALLAEDQLKAA